MKEWPACNTVLEDSKALASLIEVLVPCSLFSQTWVLSHPIGPGNYLRAGIYFIILRFFLIRFTLDFKQVLMEIIYTKNKKELSEHVCQEEKVIARLVLLSG